MSSDDDIPAARRAGDPPTRRAPAISALPHDHAAFVTTTLPPLRACATTIAWEAGLAGEAFWEER